MSGSTKAADALNCPACGADLVLAALLVDAETRQAIERLVATGLPLGSRLLQYCTLHTPPKTRLTTAKQIKLILQLLPDIEAGVITHKGRRCTVPAHLWEQAMAQMLEMRAAGSLVPPLSGHAYLYALLAGLSAKAGDAQPSLPAPRPHYDPALQKRDADDALAAPLPEAVRLFRASIKHKGFITHD